MLSDEFITNKKKELTDLGNLLHKESNYARQIVEHTQNPDNEKKWFSSVTDVCIYGTFLIQNLITTLDNYKEKSEEQIGFYIGKIGIQSFLDIINAFELSTKNLVAENENLSKLLNARIQTKIDLIENGWKTEVNRKSRDFKNGIKNTYKRKIQEMNFIRETIKKENIINDLDNDILQFSWDIRNSMHTNFLAIKNMEFNAPNTSLNYSFTFKEGEELYHPNDLKSFYQMTEQIIFIQHKILQHFNNITL